MQDVYPRTFSDSDRKHVTQILAKLLFFGALLFNILMLFSSDGSSLVVDLRHLTGRNAPYTSVAAGVLVFGCVCQLLAHLSRISTLLARRLLRQSFGGGLSDAAFMYGFLGGMSLVLFGPAIVIWLYVHFGTWSLTRVWLPFAFMGLSLFSVLAYRRSWNYGIYPRSEGSRTVSTQTPGPEPSASTSPIWRLKPSLTFKDIHGNGELKQRLLQAARGVLSRSSRQSVRNGILLTGDPGNGKTVLAEALAGELKLAYFKLTHSDVASPWVGERTVRIKAAFDQAIQSQPSLLFVDEIDSFIPDRRSQISQVKEDTDVVNTLLTLLVDVRKHKVVVVAASNLLDRLDGAAVREGRFDFKFEVPVPDLEGRIGLLRQGLAKNARGFTASEQTVQSVAKRWNGFSVKRILAVTEELPAYLNSVGRSSGAVQFEDFMMALRRIQGRAGFLPENAMPINQLVLSAATRHSLHGIARRMADPLHVESRGGTLPTGILLSGPAGTGKTTACKSLAKEVGWAFLPTTGAELARDPRALQAIYDQAKDLRPAIIFVDEADDLLRSREYSSCTDSTNKLLSLMDGTVDRVSDVVWVAATNHPDTIDPALLRGGRFTEKILFELPSSSQLATHTRSWLAERKVRTSPGLDAGQIAELIGEQSIANLEAILQDSLNRAIGRTDPGQDIRLQRPDILAARQTVCPD